MTKCPKCGKGIDFDSNDFGSFATNPKWTCVLTNKNGKEKTICLGLYNDYVDWEEAGLKGSPEGYPISINTSLMVVPDDIGKDYMDKVLKGFGVMKSSNITPYDIYAYGGGVPVNVEDISKVGESTNTKYKQKIVNGDNIKFFESKEDADEYVKEIIIPRSEAVFSLIGFYLDNPVNRMGTTGWDIVRQQAFGIEPKWGW